MQHIQEVGRQHSYAAPVPPINNQQNFLKPPIAGEQNLSNSQMHSHLLSAPPTDHSQIMNPPMTGVPGPQIPSRLPTGPHGPHGQISTGHQAHGTNLPNANLLQSGMAPYNSVLPPPLPSQGVASPMDPDLSSQIVPPNLTGQSIASPPPVGPGFHQARQKQYLQNAPMPPMPPMPPGQTATNPTGPGLLPPAQRQYAWTGSTMPPLSGQTLSSPLGVNRASPGVTPGYQQPPYQQPYHNQMVQLYIKKFSNYEGKTGKNS